MGVRRLLRWLFVAVLLGVAPLRCPGGDPAPPSSEYQVKAIFLYNFAQFAEWPSSAFVDAQAPIVIAILGSDPFGAYLDEVVRDENVGGRRLVVRRCRNIAETQGCHILFVSRSESARLRPILHAVRNQPVLTISDAEGFNRQGGMVRFVMDGGKVRLRIAVDAAKAAGITISSKILRPSTIVAAGRD